jgi:hypothetical protein
LVSLLELIVCFNGKPTGCLFRFAISSNIFRALFTVVGFSSIEIGFCTSILIYIGLTFVTVEVSVTYFDGDGNTLLAGLD